MAYGDDEKVVIKLRGAEQGGELVETLANGEERTYHVREFGVHWTCERLQVRQELAHGGEDEQGPPKWQTYIWGRARLAEDHNVGVIGEPANTTATVEVSFRVDDSPDLLNRHEGDPWERWTWTGLGRASLGFNRGDWEIRTKDCWWLQCTLHSSALQPLIDAITAGTLEQASLRVRLGNLYTDGFPLMPFASAEHLFLRPNKKDNSVKLPETADGWLEGLNLGLRSAETTRPRLAPKEELEGESEEIVDSRQPPVVQALQLVIARMEALRGTIQWVGGLAVIMLLLLLFK